MLSKNGNNSLEPELSRHEYKPFRPKEQVGLGDSPKRIDLAKPDTEAAERAAKLQKMPMNVFFSKAALFTGQ